MHVSRKKGDEETKNASVRKWTKGKEESEQSWGAQCFHSAAEGQGGQRHGSDQFKAREIMSRK